MSKQTAADRLESLANYGKDYDGYLPQLKKADLDIFRNAAELVRACEEIAAQDISDYAIESGDVEHAYRMVVGRVRESLAKIGEPK